MKKIFFIFVFTTSLLISCDKLSNKTQMNESMTANSETLLNGQIVHKTKNLIIRKLSNHIYKHTSFLSTKDFGNVACNGMIVVDNKEAVIFDTPSDNNTSEELINYIVNRLQCKLNGVISTHFHEDCVGGIEKFYEYNIPVHASNITIDLLKKNGRVFSKPIKSFDNNLSLQVGDEKVYAEYFGEGHTKDNIIGYFPKDKTLFGGCLIKELGAKKGNLEDANTKEWSATVRKINQKYSEAKVVIPGHGKTGGTELLDYTIRLFE